MGKQIIGDKSVELVAIVGSSGEITELNSTSDSSSRGEGGDLPKTLVDYSVEDLNNLTDYEVIPSNPERQGLLIQNRTQGSIYIDFGVEPQPGRSLEIKSNGFWFPTFRVSDAIYVKGEPDATAANEVVVIKEMVNV